MEHVNSVHVYKLNPIHVCEKAVEECVFCLESNNSVIKNDRCKCLYHFHISCRDSWIKTLRDENKPILCLMCRTEYTELPEHIYIVINEEITDRLTCRRKLFLIFITLSIIVIILMGYRLFF